MPKLDNRTRRSLVRIVLVALAVRLVVMLLLYPQRLKPDQDHFAFGYETGRIAQAIASGQGFSSPMPLPTGPTAWMTPVYPCIVAAIFKMCGIYSKASLLTILTLQDLFSALTCLPIFAIGRRTFGAAVGVRAGWVWAFLPYAIYVPNHWVWDTSLTTFLLSLLFLMTLRLEATTRMREWLGFGFLWGLTALTNPVVLSVLPPLLCWLWWGHHQRAKRSGRFIGAALLVLVVTVAPWFVRNYRIFGRVIPFRSNFGAVLRMGNSENVGSPRIDALNPAESDDEMTRFRQIGELAYVAEKQRDALQFMRSHLGTFVWLTLGRVVYWWTGFWLPAPFYLVATGWPATELLNALFWSSLSVLAFLGLRRAFRNLEPEAWLYLIVLLFFPLIYYVTSPHLRFRHPIDPPMALLAAYAVSKEP